MQLPKVRSQLDREIWELTAGKNQNVVKSVMWTQFRRKRIALLTNEQLQELIDLLKKEFAS